VSGFDGPEASKDVISFFVHHGYRLAVENVIACRNGNCDVYLESFGDDLLDAAVDLKRCSMYINALFFCSHFKWFAITCAPNLLLTRGKTAVQDLSAALAAAIGSVRDMPKHFCELQLDELGLRCFSSHSSLRIFQSL
jgi:hypothetical protein